MAEQAGQALRGLLHRLPRLPRQLRRRIRGRLQGPLRGPLRGRLRGRPRGRARPRSLRRTLGTASGTLSALLCAVALGGAALGVAPAQRPGAQFGAGFGSGVGVSLGSGVGGGVGSSGARSAADGVPVSSDSLGRGADQAVPATRAPLPRSTPLQLMIPSIGLSAPLLGLGTDSRGNPEVPPFSQPRTAGWIRDTVTPGEAGTAVLVGHVDTRTGPAVLWNLSAVKPGALVEVARLDGSTARFTVDRLRTYPKDGFPNALVYGASADPQLRIITCGGGYDRARQEYSGNVVLFAHLTGAG